MDLKRKTGDNLYEWTSVQQLLLQRPHHLLSLQMNVIPNSICKWKFVICQAQPIWGIGCKVKIWNLWLKRWTQLQNHKRAYQWSCNFFRCSSTNTSYGCICKFAGSPKDLGCMLEPDCSMLFASSCCFLLIWNIYRSITSNIRTFKFPAFCTFAPTKCTLMKFYLKLKKY